MGEPATASRAKKTMTLIWSIAIVAIVLGLLAAIAGPKFATFRRRTAAVPTSTAAVTSTSAAPGSSEGP